jgi:formylmethanofuran dehydrogenase subunit A
MDVYMCLHFILFRYIFQDNRKEWANRRRPALSAATSVSKKYEEVADIKKEIGTTQLAILKRSEQLQIKMIEETERKLTIQRRREEELHQFEIRKQELDVAIREAQLELLLEKTKNK